jgi:hydrogenase maturation protein HypF
MTGKKESAIDIVVFGVVQGVGFRPFIYRLAHELDYNGWVQNIGFGVKIHLENQKKSDFQDFLQALYENKPPLAQIEEATVETASFTGIQHFEIRKSKQEESFVFISPDISVCRNCYTEMMTPSDRRFQYPFINCTDCGPRYTIVRALPYDRKKTTMKRFRMCPLCRKEYTDPLDRRYHAQPIACPACGPHITLLNSKTREEIEGGIQKSADLLKKGKILAVKGLGGFHLMCDALNSKAVENLRRIKERERKPLALMARDLKIIRKFAHISPGEKELLLSPRRPIVLLKKKKEIEGIAPHLDEMGFMLPYTPLHYLLLQDFDLIVATSSNKKDAPIMKDEEEGIDELTDFILTHDRPIHMRADDSVMKVIAHQPLFVRRARGYVPYPQPIPRDLLSPHHILALGGELKDTISLYKNGYIITSQFLGDLDEYQNFQYFEETIRHLTKLFQIRPKVVVSDLHPDFHTTRYAQKLKIPHLKVQHHFAHVLAPLIEHKYSVDKKVLGVSLDGYGYGEDGTAWGGEFLIADYAGYERFAHFAYVPLPGGDLAAKQPWRMALAYLMEVYGEEIPWLDVFKKVSPKKNKGLREMIRRQIQTPPVSSCGRLFDAVSFLVGLSPEEMEFEAEAPMRLEAAAAEGIRGKYEFEIVDRSISFKRTIRSVVEDLQQGEPVPRISAKFHNTLASVIGRVAQRAREIHGIDTVVLVGGVFLNKRLLEAASKTLRRKGLNVLRPVKYSPNDESISVGQIAYALMSLLDMDSNSPDKGKNQVK